MPELQLDDAARVVWGDGFVLGTGDGSGAVAAVERYGIGFIRLLAVAPSARRRGLGTELLRAAVEQLGTDEVIVGGEAPFYLWPGVDTQWTEALAFFEARGYARVGVELNMTCDASFTAEPPPGVVVSRVDNAEEVLGFVGANWPNWVDEARRAIELGTCFAATDVAEVVGFIGHSVNRVGWLGPMGTVPRRQGGGVGTALVAAVCADARAAGRSEVEVAWVGPVGFYAKAVGAVVSRAFVRMRSRSSR